MSKSLKNLHKDLSFITRVLMALDVGDITAKEAAIKMQCSLATVYNRLRTFASSGKVQFKHGNTGHSPVNKMPAEDLARLKSLLATKYADFNSQQAVGYLKQDEGISVSREKVRRLMHEINSPEKKGKNPHERLHKPRRRRARFGELIQLDGIPHNWLMLPGPDPYTFCLTIFIDDATSRITAAQFSATESSETYLALLELHVRKYGIPQAFYSDRHSIFLPPNSPSKHMSAKQEVAATQYQRVCAALGIECIYAYSPAAKGRVERAFRTLQGRWPQELKLKGAKSIEDANKLLPDLVKAFNEEFSIRPYEEGDAHVPFTDDNENLHRLCAHWSQRKLSSRMTCQYKDQLLQVTGMAETWALKHAEVSIVEYPNGKLEMIWRDPRDRKLKLLSFQLSHRQQTEPVEKYVTAKEVDNEWKERMKKAERSRRSKWLTKRELQAEQALRRREEEVRSKESLVQADLDSKEKSEAK